MMELYLMAFPQSYSNCSPAEICGSLVICSASLDLAWLPHLLPPNLYPAERERNSNKKAFLQKLQAFTCQRTELESINMHILKMNLPYRMNQAASLKVENDVQLQEALYLHKFDLDSRELDFNKNLFNI